jgi:hypothetical protein
MQVNLLPAIDIHALELRPDKREIVARVGQLGHHPSLVVSGQYVIWSDTALLSPVLDHCSFSLAKSLLQPFTIMMQFDAIDCCYLWSCQHPEYLWMS